MSFLELPSELLLLVALISTVVVLLSLNGLAEMLQESSRWERVRSRIRRRRRTPESKRSHVVSGEVIDAPMP